MGERTLQNGFNKMIAEKVYGISVTLSSLEIGKSIKCSHFCD